MNVLNFNFLLHTETDKAVNVKVAKLYTQMDSLVLQMHSAVVLLLRTSHARASLVTKIQMALDSTALVSN